MHFIEACTEIKGRKRKKLKNKTEKTFQSKPLDMKIWTYNHSKKDKKIFLKNKEKIENLFFTFLLSASFLLL